MALRKRSRLRKPQAIFLTRWILELTDSARAFVTSRTTALIIPPADVERCRCVVQLEVFTVASVKLNAGVQFQRLTPRGAPQGQRHGLGLARRPGAGCAVWEQHRQQPQADPTPPQTKPATRLALQFVPPSTSSRVFTR